LLLEGQLLACARDAEHISSLSSSENLVFRSSSDICAAS
jgi:hypothetical protein